MYTTGGQEEGGMGDSRKDEKWIPGRGRKTGEWEKSVDGGGRRMLKQKKNDGKPQRNTK